MKRNTQLFILLIVCIPLFLGFIYYQSSVAESTQGNTSDIITSFSIPQTVGAPFQMAVETVGSPTIIWFTVPDNDVIGELVINGPSNFSVNSYDVSTNGQPYDIVFDGTDKMWFTLAGTDQIGHIDVNTEVVTEINIPSGDTPHGIDIAPNG
ncbi:MAG: hypothetical protein AAF490_11540, partial [Chloroflexota bacterium]